MGDCRNRRVSRGSISPQFGCYSQPGGVIRHTLWEGFQRSRTETKGSPCRRLHLAPVLQGLTEALRGRRPRQWRADGLFSLQELSEC